jgi:F-box domain
MDPFDSRTLHHYFYPNIVQHFTLKDLLVMSGVSKSWFKLVESVMRGAVVCDALCASHAMLRRRGNMNVAKHPTYVICKPARKLESSIVNAEEITSNKEQ